HAEESVKGVRDRAVTRWNECLAELPPDGRGEALGQAAEELGDATKETLTFLEDLSLADAVRGLETLEDDVETCRQAVDQHGPPDARKLRKRLKRHGRMIAGELQERRLAWRMESLFGRWFVAALERLILVLLLLFVVMLIVEGPLLEYEAARAAAAGAGSGPGVVAAVFAWSDLAICAVFFFEFSLKWVLARRKWLYFRRNWFTGLLPSIPFGFIAYAATKWAIAEKVEGLLLLRFGRYARLPRMARWLRIARPVLRAMRVLAFVIKASDRLVRQLTPVLNRNLVFFERAAVAVAEPEYRTKLSALHERFYYRAAETIHWLPPSAQFNLVKARIGDLTAMLGSPLVGPPVPAAAVGGPTSRDVPVEQLVGRLLSATPAVISDRIGRTLAQSVARWCKALDVFAVRRLPLVRDLVSAGRLPSPYDTTARVANRLGLLLERRMDRVYWFADLYGTVTPPQLLDSVGEYLVKATRRPVVRLGMFTVAFFFVSALPGWLGIPGLSGLADKLGTLVKALLVLVGICAVPLGIGAWFRWKASEASDFYRRVAAAQFITATRQFKRKLAEDQHAVFHRRVIAPEQALADRAEHTGAEPSGSAPAAVGRLWEEYLEGPPFHPSDTVTSSQLLGNLALISLRETRLPVGRRRKKRLRQLDLANARPSLRGPYLWFRFISGSLAHHTAKLVESYNAFVLPLSRAATAEDWEIESYAGWLSQRLSQPVEQLDLPRPFRERLDALAAAADRAECGPKRPDRWFQGNDFTAVHFLSADSTVEADVRRRYGDLLADLMRRDRRDNIRRVFRTYPFHRWPKERRTFNFLPFYERHLAGGRVLLLPLKALVWTVFFWFRMVRFTWGLVGEVRDPKVRELSSVEDPDPFEVARRKIHRMRKPLYLECLQTRADFDPEYLGIVPPGVSSVARESAVVQIEEDLARIAAEPAVRLRFREMANRRRRQILEFRRWLDRFGADGFSSESLRAMAIAYTIDYRGARTRLEAARLLEEAFRQAIDERSQPRSVRTMPRPSLRSLWCGMRTRRKLSRLFGQSMFADFDRRQRAVCRRCLRRRRGPLLAALKQLTRRRAGTDPAADARRELAGVGRDPATWSRQLVVLRAVQTLSVLDLETYCKLVYEVGEYDADGR
ncbi:MAG: ion transporter, partial [Planctomycetota bacterium]